LKIAGSVAEAFRAGADYLTLAVLAALGPNGLVRMAAEVAAPLRDAIG
jgi:hypothetical protein